MAEFTTNELSLAIPSAWIDRSTNVLQPVDGDSPTRVVLSRATADLGLDEYAGLELKMLTQQIPWFTLIEEGERLVASVRARTVRATFRDGKLELYQHRVIFPARNKFLSLTAVAPSDQREHADRTLAGILATLVFRSTT
jgi:hypothetical protein